ncbi:MAG: T9SS type A sorting domain-containing protein, partial [Saprospiraceae bacterium]
YWEKSAWEQGMAHVFDALGRRMAAFDLQASPDSSGEMRISAANWPPGIYYVRLQSGYRIETKSLLLTR